ncbi:hypothetical protein QN277_021139 [Acacia crassicarpa]|uniref:Uncharacterized protein n=1 Tax=Acacia crassicarpa TaxID=499986 RepID=A0AAE1JR52_9FABA|nr:hypothetical protein QN277_021139 [Acacia crassicarpa]
MPEVTQKNEQFSNGSSTTMYKLSANGFWSNNRDDVNYNQLQKFWSELSPRARQELLRIDKQTLFEQARKNMYCSRCNGLLLEGFLQIVMYGKSLQQDGAGTHFNCKRPGGLGSQNIGNGGSSMMNGFSDEIQDPSVHPWGGLTTTRDNSLTLMDCYLYSKSLKGLQIVFDGARARERERALLYPDACGGGGRGWVSQGILSYGRGHGTRETCALHTARLSCDTLVDFWSALGDETRKSLLRMKEEDFIERLMYRFDSKRFCRDCRRNVIREFKGLKELKRTRREPRCTNWFCAADTAFQYEVSDDSIQADWRQTFADTLGSYHHFEWAVGTSEGKSDILEFENVGMNRCVQVNGLDLCGLSACLITLRAWKLDGRCTELSVKAHALKGQRCVHYRLIVGEGYVTIVKGESIRRFFEHAEEAEEEEDDDSIDKDGKELDGECSRPQKHAKSPELAREFLLDAASVIFKEQVEKAFREGTARQNAHSIFVCLALKLLEERVNVACKEIITLEKQMKLLEEEERKERRRTKEREKKLRRKERLKGREKDKEKKGSESNNASDSAEFSKEEFSSIADMQETSPNSCRNSATERGGANILRDESTNTQEEEKYDECNTVTLQDHSYNGCDGEIINTKSDMGTFTVEQSRLSRRKSRYRKDFQLDMPMKWSDRRRYAVVSESVAKVGRSETRHYGDAFVVSSRGFNGSNRKVRVNASNFNGRHGGPKYNEKLHCPNNHMTDKCDFHSCSCNVNNEYRIRVDQRPPVSRVNQEKRPTIKSDSVMDRSKQSYYGSKYDQVDLMHDNCGRPRSRIISGNYANRDLLQSKKVWEPMESKKYPPSNSDSDVTSSSVALNFQRGQSDTMIRSSADEAGNSGKVDHGDGNLRESSGMDQGCQNLVQETECLRSSTEFASEEAGLRLTGVSILKGSSDPCQGSTSNSDNCSSCLSEGDSNMTSSNRENTESSTTSDSEDASQQSEGRESSAQVDNGLSDCFKVGVGKNQNSYGEGLASRLPFGPSLVGAGSDGLCDPVTEISHNLDNENVFSTPNPCSQPQSRLPPVPNPNMHFPVFQVPSTMGFYHQNLVSWPTASTNELTPFPHQNHYLYDGPLGYGINEDLRFCMQYGALQQPMPLFNHATFPVYQPVTNAKGLKLEERSQLSKPASIQDHDGIGSTAQRVASEKPALNGEVGHDNSANSTGNNGDFSLFHFGGPVALSAGCESTSASSNCEPVGNFCSKTLADHVQNDRSCSEEETTNMEVYNLFAASCGLRFSIF